MWKCRVPPREFDESLFAPFRSSGTGNSARRRSSSPPPKVSTVSVGSRNPRAFFRIETDAAQYLHGFLASTVRSRAHRLPMAAQSSLKIVEPQTSRTIG